MLARRYETRLNEDGLITFEKVWSKRIDIKKKNNLDTPSIFMNYAKLYDWTHIQKNMRFYSCLIQKCTSNHSLRLGLAALTRVLSIDVE